MAAAKDNKNMYTASKMKSRVDFNTSTSGIPNLFATYDTSHKTRQGPQFASQGKRHGSTMGLTSGAGSGFFNKVGLRNNRNMRESTDQINSGKYQEDSARKNSSNRTN